MVDKTTDKAGDKTQNHNPHEATNLFARSVEDQIARTEDMFRELEKIQKQSLERATMAIDESAKLMKASVEYAAKLNNEWRQIALEISRQGMRLYGSMWSSMS